MDAAGHSGSPLIIIGELEQYIRSRKTPVASGVKITLHFNDLNNDNIACLQSALDQKSDSLHYRVELTCLPFAEVFSEKLADLQNSGTTNLVIIDQCGIKEVNQRVFKALLKCLHTDILFFVSSSYIRRFITENSVQH